MSKHPRITRCKVIDAPLLPPPRKLGPEEVSMSARDIKRHQLHGMLMSYAKRFHLSEVPEPLRLYGGRTLRYYVGGVICEYRTVTPTADVGVFAAIFK